MGEPSRTPRPWAPEPPAPWGAALPWRAAPRLTPGSSAHHGVSRGEALPSVAAVTGPLHLAARPRFPARASARDVAAARRTLGERTGQPRRRLQEGSPAPHPGSCRASWHPRPPTSQKFPGARRRHWSLAGTAGQCLARSRHFRDHSGMPRADTWSHGQPKTTPRGRQGHGQRERSRC